MTEIQWPPRWQEEAKRVISRYFGRDARLRIVVDDPATAIDGSVLEGFVYLDDVIPTIIHDRSGRPDVYPWPLLAGPLLRIYELVPRRKPFVVYAHPGLLEDPSGHLDIETAGGRHWCSLIPPV